MALIVLDASIAIGLLDPADAGHAASVRALLAHADDDVRLPASALAETLVVPARRGVMEVARSHLRELALEIAPIDEDVAAEAATLRSRHRTLRLPDALVVAAARVLGADLLLTTDRALAQLAPGQLVR